MRRWGSLSEKQQHELDQLFATPPTPKQGEAFEAMKARDGDAMPFVRQVQEIWQEIDQVRRQGVEAYRAAFRSVAALTPTDPAERQHEPFKQKLFLIYDHYGHPRPLLGEPDWLGDRLWIFDLLQGRGRPRVKPTTEEVDARARKLVEQSLKEEPQRYARKRQSKESVEIRYSERLVQDLAAHFDVSRSRIQNRLDEAVFSLEREYPDLAYPLPIP